MNSTRLQGVLICGVLTTSLLCGKPKELDLDGQSFWLHDAKSVSAMEQRANDARDLFWTGDYQESFAIFDQLCQQAHNSSPLFLRERAMARLALTGDLAQSAPDLLASMDQIDSFRIEKLEKEATSLFGKESIKIYGGDPYENAMAYTLLALHFFQEGDIDNALAACKSGILADADSTEGLYDSDITLLHLLEAKCYDLRGDFEGGSQSRRAAAESHRTTHPTVRDIFSDRLNLIALLKLNTKERKRLGERRSEDEIRAELHTLDDEIAAASANVDVEGELGALYTGDFNTLMLVPNGQVVRKSRRGKEGNFVVFDGNGSAPIYPTINIGEDAIDAMWVHSVADVDFQATTRGGRRMDGLLAGQAAFRSTTIGVGSFISSMGEEVGGLGGFALEIVGTVVQGVAAQVSAEADVRSWRTLPSGFAVAALTLPPGEHEITQPLSVYFARQSLHRTKLNVAEGRIATFFSPFPNDGQFSESAIKASTKRKRRFPKEGTDPATMLALAPPLGIAAVERVEWEGMKRPLALAPDSSSLVRRIEKQARANGWATVPAIHHEIVANPHAAARGAKQALQIEYLKGGAVRKKGRTAFEAHYRVSWIDVDSGEVIRASEYVAENGGTKGSRPDATAMFNACFDDMLEQAFNGVAAPRG